MTVRQLEAIAVTLAVCSCEGQAGAPKQAAPPDPSPTCVASTLSTQPSSLLMVGVQPHQSMEALVLQYQNDMQALGATLDGNKHIVVISPAASGPSYGAVYSYAVPPKPVPCTKDSIKNPLDRRERIACREAAKAVRHWESCLEHTRAALSAALSDALATQSDACPTSNGLIETLAKVANQYADDIPKFMYVASLFDTDVDTLSGPLPNAQFMFLAPRDTPAHETRIHHVAKALKSAGAFVQRRVSGIPLDVQRNNGKAINEPEPWTPFEDRHVVVLATFLNKADAYDERVRLGALHEALYASLDVTEVEGHWQLRLRLSRGLTEQQAEDVRKALLGQQGIREDIYLARETAKTTIIVKESLGGDPRCL